jgi:hypothetical protein
MSQQVAERVEPKRHVRVWFGEHVIASYVAERELAETYANAMSRRYAGLRVTNEPVPDVDPHAQPLPPARIWDAVDPH